jgi:hypothetical protein
MKKKKQKLKTLRIKNRVTSKMKLLSAKTKKKNPRYCQRTKSPKPLQMMKSSRSSTCRQRKKGRVGRANPVAMLLHLLQFQILH